jgi:hypothetical protein
MRWVGAEGQKIGLGSSEDENLLYSKNRRAIDQLIMSTIYSSEKLTRR